MVVMQNGNFQHKKWYRVSRAVSSKHIVFLRLSNIVVFLPKSRFVLKDGSRSLGLFRNGKICIIAKLHRTDFVIYSHF